MIIHRYFGRTVGALVVVFATFATATPASAHSYAIEIDGGLGAVERNHTRFYACDRKADNLSVYVEWYKDSSHWGNVRDGNGSKPGCGIRDLDYDASPGIWRLCVATTCTKYDDV